ncbi:MAG: EAL domain-containing protein [Clostridiaceae bacterium]|nr:EAL domain-containing protein [Clostridiaceae bacterium]
MNFAPFFRSWIFFGLAAAFWAAADIGWAVWDLVLKKNPANNLLISGFYLGTTIFLFIGICHYSIYKFKRWNTIQLVIDGLFIALSCILYLWIMLFDKNDALLWQLDQEDWMSVANLGLDLVIFLGIAVWYISIRGGKIPFPIRIIASSLFLFTLVDIYYFYLQLNHRYIPNSVIDAAYIAAILGIAIGANAFTDLVLRQADAEIDVCTNIGFRHRSLLLFPAPILILLIKGFDFSIIFYLAIMIVYGSLSAYIQAAINNERLLKREMELNLELESRILERTKELVEKNRQLFAVSNMDTVTNLSNRRFFLQTLEEHIKQEPGRSIALLLIDIDRFKIINDTYGHQIGDRILILLSQRLQHYEQSGVMLARLGGDEFVLIVPSRSSYAEIEQLSEHLIEHCTAPIELDQYTLRITFSIGVSIYPLDAENSNTLLQHADIAMYQAKKAGNNKCVSFNENILKTIKRKNELELLLKKADYDKEFSLVYQPQFTASTNQLIGMEALLWWNCPEKGGISPAEFIPIAEETDLIIPIGSWVMQEAVRQIADWNRYYDLNLTMGINVSPKQLDQKGFHAALKATMNRYSVKAEWIDLEITEGVAVEGEGRIGQIVEQFMDSGISISIDDFGTGYSSLSYWKLFPFDRVKIAKQLIDNLAGDRYDRQIVKSIILLADSLGIKTIAEGVETPEQLDWLIKLGCRQIQGYLLGKPMPADAFEDKLLVSQPLPDAAADPIDTVVQLELGGEPEIYHTR